ncbi:Zn(2)-C6 fungal-type DNA-binding domain protein [Metarhizium brunneum]
MPEASGIKRPRNQSDETETGKRRAPYALRACDTCRRRKVKCDGSQPCAACTGRHDACCYSGDLGLFMPTPAAHVQSRQADAAASTNPEHASIIEIMSSFQSQLDDLASRLQSASQGRTSQPAAADARRRENGHAGVSTASASRAVPSSTAHAPPVATQGFYGPTSPDYSLNVAQMKLRQTTLLTTEPHGQQLQLASIDNDVASHREHGADNAGIGGRELGDQFRLLQFRSLFDSQEAMRLLSVYQEVIGEFHPVIDINGLMAQAQRWYAEDNSPWSLSPEGGGTSVDQDLVILNLALAIALRAESTSSVSEVERYITENCQGAANARITAPVSSVKQVTIALLSGWHYLFHDAPRSAWRMCGIAGHMLMELGYHNGHVLKQVLDNETQTAEVYSIICSVIILDRQWSASTGLPTHFKTSSFDPLPKDLVKNPYLKAMLAFIIISDKFGEPIFKAAKGESYLDEDAFEVMNIQIDQWRKKAVGDVSLAQLGSSLANPSMRPPSWVILLNLRAESARSLLLKPCFFLNTDIEDGKKYLPPAIELVYNMVNTLYLLDSSTNIYRTQHPFYQHLLASACALAFLVVAFIEQNKTLLLATLPANLTDWLSRSLQMAVALATNYAHISRASGRLLQRLSEMRGILVNLGLLKGQDCQDKVFPNSNKDGPSAANTSKMSQRKRISTSALPDQFSPSFANFPVAAAYEAGLGSVPGTDMPSGWAESIWAHWPFCDDDNLFLENQT